MVVQIDRTVNVRYYYVFLFETQPHLQSTYFELELSHRTI